jgi:hypothetical protein
MIAGSASKTPVNYGGGAVLRLNSKAPSGLTICRFLRRTGVRDRVRDQAATRRPKLRRSSILPYGHHGLDSCNPRVGNLASRGLTSPGRRRANFIELCRELGAIEAFLYQVTPNLTLPVR